MIRELALALLVLAFLFTPAGPLYGLESVALFGLSIWVTIDRGVDVAMSFWNRWISP